MKHKYASFFKELTVDHSYKLPHGSLKEILNVHEKMNTKSFELNLPRKHNLMKICTMNKHQQNSFILRLLTCP